MLKCYPSAERSTTPGAMPYRDRRRQSWGERTR